MGSRDGVGDQKISYFAGFVEFTDSSTKCSILVFMFWGSLEVLDLVTIACESGLVAL